MSLTRESLLNRLNITDKQGTELVQAALENPVNALTLLNSFDVSQDALQELIGEFMMNPGVFIDLAREMNIPNEKIEEFRTRFGI